jgi:hypothetical protein
VEFESLVFVHTRMDPLALWPKLSTKFTSRLPISPLRDSFLHDNLRSKPTMADILEDNCPAEPIAPPKKRSIFNKAILEKASEADEAVEFFSRAKEIYPQRLAEEERKRQKKIVKLERKRSSTSAEIKESTPPGGKKRKVSSQGGGLDGHSSDSAGEVDHEERSWNRRWVPIYWENKLELF